MSDDSLSKPLQCMLITVSPSVISQHARFSRFVPCRNNRPTMKHVMDSSDFIVTLQNQSRKIVSIIFCFLILSGCENTACHHNRHLFQISGLSGEICGPKYNLFRTVLTWVHCTEYLPKGFFYMLQIVIFTHIMQVFMFFRDAIPKIGRNYCSYSQVHFVLFKFSELVSAPTSSRRVR